MKNSVQPPIAEIEFVGIRNLPFASIFTELLKFQLLRSSECHRLKRDNPSPFAVMMDSAGGVRLFCFAHNYQLFQARARMAYRISAVLFFQKSRSAKEVQNENSIECIRSQAVCVWMLKVSEGARKQVPTRLRSEKGIPRLGQTQMTHVEVTGARRIDARAGKLDASIPICNPTPSASSHILHSVQS
jgi:hypothetical protein